MIDGEIVALDGRGSRASAPSRSRAPPPRRSDYVFDVLVVAGLDAMGEPLSRRRELISTRVLPLLHDPIRESPVLEASRPDLIQSAKAQGLEGSWPSASITGTSQGSARAPGGRCGCTRAGIRDRRLHAGRAELQRDHLRYHDAEGQLFYAAYTRSGFTRLGDRKCPVDRRK